MLRRFGPAFVLCFAVAASAAANSFGLPEDPAEVNALDQQKAFVLFSMLRHQDLAYDFPADGCYARCHLMTLQMRQMGVELRRAWAFSGKTRLFAKTPKGTMSWDFHVAPLVPVRVGDKVQWLVFDPTMLGHPVPLEEWGNAMRKNDSFPMPTLTTTQLGEPPLRNGKRTGGSGYWVGGDPREGATAHATNMIKGYIAKRPKTK